MNLTAHFTLDELVRSDVAIRKGIDNTPDADVLSNLYMLAAGLERVRNVLAVPIHISSGYRCPKLNAAVGGSRTSSHMSGLAADFTAPEFGNPREICGMIADRWTEIEFDQLICEGRWVHISFADTPRHEILTAHFNSGLVTYTKGLA